MWESVNSFEILILSRVERCCMEWIMISTKQDLEEKFYCWYKKLGENIYNLIYFFDDVGDGRIIVDIETVDLDDVGINWEEANAMYSNDVRLDTDIQGVEKARALSMIYGSEKFGARYNCNNRNQAFQMLKDNGINVENWIKC